MTHAEITTALRGYATDDTQICIEEGSIAITNTSWGCTFLEYVECSDMFVATDNALDQTRKTFDTREECIEWLVSDQYTIEIAA